MKAYVFYALLAAFVFLAEKWEKFMDATVPTIICVLVPSFLFLVLIIDSLIQGLPEPHPRSLWIALTVLTPLFIVSAIAVTKKTKKEWRPTEWMR